MREKNEGHVNKNYFLKLNGDINLNLSDNTPFIMLRVGSICLYAMEFFLKNSINPLFSP